MNQKSRKPLHDALAQQFVYGGEGEPKEGKPTKTDIKGENSLLSESEEIDTQSPSPTVQATQSVTRTKAENKEMSLMDKLQVKSKEATTRFTVDLPESMHRKLSILAARTGRKKAEIVRMLLDEALKDIEN